MTRQGSVYIDVLQVFYPVWVDVCGLAPVIRRPLGLVLGNECTMGEYETRLVLCRWGSCLEQPHCLDHVRFIKRETVVDASGKDHEVTSIECASDPLIGGMIYP